MHKNKGQVAQNGWFSYIFAWRISLPYHFKQTSCRSHLEYSIPNLNLLFPQQVSIALRSFGHQGALYYVFLASDPLKTSREYAVFTLRTRGPKVCTRETSHQTQRVMRFCFDCAKWSHYFIHRRASWRPGQNFIMFRWTKNERFGKNGNIIIVQKTKMGP